MAAKQKPASPLLGDISVSGRRRLRRDNIATRSQPVMRLRVVTPLTPRAVREQIVEAASESGRPDRYVARRLTPLDRALSDAEADALERFADAESLFISGLASRFEQRRCDTSASRLPFGPTIERELRALAAVKRALSPSMLRTGAVFVAQMRNDPDAPSFSEAAARLGMNSASDYVAAVLVLARALEQAYATQPPRPFTT